MAAIKSSLARTVLKELEVQLRHSEVYARYLWNQLENPVLHAPAAPDHISERPQRACEFDAAASSTGGL